jgi:hypothetical protein
MSTTTAKKTIQSAQERLLALGYQPGAADGAMGARAIAALKEFQTDHNLPVTGQLDQKTLDALSANGSSRPNQSKAPRSAQTNLLPSEEVMIQDTGGQKFSGTIAVTADSSDCRIVEFTVDKVRVAPAAGEDSANMSPDAFSIFYPGITFRFANHSCIPAKGTSPGIHFNLEVNGEPGASMGLQNGRLVTSGPLIVSGKNTTGAPFAASIIDIEPSTSDSLVFELTEQGYRYISGTGSVKLPSGKVFKFPLAP